MSDKQITVIRNPAEHKGKFPLDENVIKELPIGCTVLDSVRYRPSAWTETAQVSVRLADGKKKDYFLKCTVEGGEVMMEGEFNSMTALYSVMPSFVPAPIAWGKYKTSLAETYFFLCDFVDMKGQMPDPAGFCARLAELHRSSKSPTGQFGFHVQNCHGKLVQHNKWDESWTSYFTELITNFYEIERGMSASWQ